VVSSFAPQEHLARARSQDGGGFSPVASPDKRHPASRNDAEEVYDAEPISPTYGTANGFIDTPPTAARAQKADPSLASLAHRDKAAAPAPRELKSRSGRTFMSMFER
jgi:hypothetical protein